MARPDKSTSTIAHQLLECVDLIAHRELCTPLAPAIVHVAATPPAHGLSLGLCPIPGRGTTVTDALIAFDAPTQWLAIGGVQMATIEGGAVSTVHLVHRSGVAAWSVSAGDAAMERAASTGGTGPRSFATPAHRLLDDACRRAMHLATAAPTCGTVVLWATLWLDAIVARAAAVPTWQPAWSEVAALHPAASIDVGTPSPAALVRRAYLLGQARPWEHLRRCCASEAWSIPFLPASAAAQMDEGSFSRWVLAGFPALSDLAATAADLLSPATGALVGAVAERWASGR